MDIAARINGAKYEAFRLRAEMSIAEKLLVSLAMAAITGLVAQVRFVLPFTPVPITGQTFGVLLAGVLLGRWWGGVSLALYAGLGAAGVPWFAGWSGGVGAFMGPSGGYIIGFILAALFLGHFTDRYVRSRSFFTMLTLMLFANFILIHVPGLIQLNLWLTLVKGNVVSLSQLLMMGTIPFIIGDVFKAVIAAGIARGITPKKAYSREVDGDKWATWRVP